MYIEGLAGDLYLTSPARLSGRRPGHSASTGIRRGCWLPSRWNADDAKRSLFGGGAHEQATVRTDLQEVMMQADLYHSDLPRQNKQRVKGDSLTAPSL